MRMTTDVEDRGARQGHCVLRAFALPVCREPMFERCDLTEQCTLALLHCSNRTPRRISFRDCLLDFQTQTVVPARHRCESFVQCSDQVTASLACLSPRDLRAWLRGG